MSPMNAVRLCIAAALSTLPMSRMAAETTAAETTTLTVRVDRPGVKVSPALYGIFFEEINCAGDGGLYAELVRNRSFEDSDKPDAWSLVKSGECDGEMALDTEKPVSETNRRSLKLSISKGGSGRVGVANGGWWGIAVRKDEVYDLSLHTRASGGFTGPLSATIESAAGRVYAEGRIDGIGSDWKKFTLALKSFMTDPAARLVIGASRPGTVWLDVVSLFPRKTWKGRSNGLRPDIAELLLGLKPSFCRFPGGCWVEGDTLAFAQRWKTTVGDIGDRRTQYNIWQYMSTNGLGYHEYLQMCEDLGAEPLFVINCGMSHRENVPMEQMGPWVQDALDAIEYANGSADSKWGSLRAKNGHPAPFGLKYMEIGNENGGPAYQERYALFHDAIRARYPEMTLIADVPTDRRRADIVDEHYYSSPEFFISNASRYDSYDRSGPKIYVGEYAVTAGSGQGNLRGALGEAAFMTGMERNSDVVVMASYAPLFANINYKKWNPDLIYFDSSRVWGTPSYHVQKMFSENRGDVVLPTEVELAEEKASPFVRKGCIGLGTWATQAEYKDINVTKGGSVLFQSDLTKGKDGWRVYQGDWKVKDGALQQLAGGDDMRIVAGDPAWSDYTYSLKARKLGGAEGFLIMFQVEDDGNWIWWNIGGWGNSRHALENCRGGGKSIIGKDARGKIETGKWYDIRIELEGRKIRCFLDGKLIEEASQGEVKPLHAVAGRVHSTGEVIVKVVNVLERPIETRIQLEGAKDVGPEGTAVVLTSSSAADENTPDQPDRVVPVTKAVKIAGASFAHAFPARSLTVLRVKVAK